MNKEPKKIAVLISGKGTNLGALIMAVARGEINGTIELVISNRKDAYGLNLAWISKIDAMSISKFDYPRDEDFDLKILEELRARKIDLVVLAGYLRILTPVLIKEYEHRIINIHPSLIPSFCGDGFYGMRVHESVIASGVKYSGATTHFVDENVDTGLIIKQGVCRVDPFDTPKILAEKVLKIEHRILVESVAAFCDDRIVITDKKAYVEE